MLQTAVIAQEPIPKNSSQDPRFQEMLRLYQSPLGPPDEILAIEKAEKNKDYNKVLELAAAIISRPDKQFESMPYARWVKSLAYIHRANIRMDSPEMLGKALDDVICAADLGNIQAIQYVSKTLLDVYNGRISIPNRDVRPEDIEKYFRIAADLGDSFSLAMLGLGKIPSKATKEQKLYWFLLGVMRDFVMPKEQKDKIFAAIIDEYGEKTITESLSHFSGVGGIISPADSAPGRNIMATLFAESDFRGLYERDFGSRMPKPNELHLPSKPITARDHFEFVRMLTADLGYATSTLLVVGNRRYDDPSIISLDRDTIMKIVGPDDSLIVRCGPLTHVAVIYKIDKEQEKVYFMDPLYQFWERRNNSCVSSFELEEHDHNRFLAAVRFKDVTSMLEAAISIRSRIGPLSSNNLREPLSPRSQTKMDQPHERNLW